MWIVLIVIPSQCAHLRMDIFWLQIFRTDWFSERVANRRSAWIFCVQSASCLLEHLSSRCGRISLNMQWHSCCTHITSADFATRNTHCTLLCTGSILITAHSGCTNPTDHLVPSIFRTTFETLEKKLLSFTTCLNFLPWPIAKQQPIEFTPWPYGYTVCACPYTPRPCFASACFTPFCFNAPYQLHHLLIYAFSFSV
jgi:hypothetical protein